MSAQFVAAINRVLGSEGGYVNDPNDPGGETNWGISKRSYPDVDIKNLTRHDAIDIYYRDFWLKIHGDEMTDGKAYQMMDAAVNSGPAQAIRFMQQAIGVADDGYWGPVSKSALNVMLESDFIMRMLSARIRFMVKLKNFKYSGPGWMNRIAKCLEYGAEDS